MTDIPSHMCYGKKKISVLGRRMAYVDTGGDADPMVFFHGNVTSSYMWRNIIPHVEDRARCIAMDNIGQGESDKLENTGTESYRLAEHQTYIDAFMDALGIDENVTLMMHDWGAQLGLTWARTHPGAVRAVAYMQGVMGNFGWDYWPPKVADLMRRFRSADGEELVLQQNYFIEKILPAMILRDLPDDVWDEYRRPYRTPGEDRRPTLTWPREIPVEGHPADVLAVIEANNAWMAASPLPKLFIHCEPGAVLKGKILDQVRTFPNQTEVTVEGLHYVHEDNPHDIGRALAGWMATLETSQ